MARMIPFDIKPCDDTDPRSGEAAMFEALEKLPNDYYVFHSFQLGHISRRNLNQYKEAEMDFLILNPKKGMIDIEAKNGHVYFENGRWYYGNGIEMKHRGPLGQANRNRRILEEVFEDSHNNHLKDKCRILPAVWFPRISQEQLSKMAFPLDTPKELVLTQEALEDPEPFIDRIFSYKEYKNQIGRLSKYDVKSLLDILCPILHVVPDTFSDINFHRFIFHKLLRNQANVLDFLVDQKTAAINGAAGTGKTLIAVEKARRLNNENQHVLFLCFNKYLKDHLAKSYGLELPRVKFYTIDGLAHKLLDKMVEPSENRSHMFKKLEDYLVDVYLGMPGKDASEYLAKKNLAENIIIDEGQDFGQNDIVENKILEDLSSITQTANGSFYIFYDKLQMVQSNQIPKVIKDADCKLTLYKNCRNTANIAKTSIKPVSDKKPDLPENAIPGTSPTMYYAENQEGVLKALNESIKDFEKLGYRDIVILTLKTESQSILAAKVKVSEKDNRLYYKGKYLFTTCRKFKGLQADCIVLVDFDVDTFDGNKKLLFYVGTSRAKFELRIISTLSDEDCRKYLLSSNNIELKPEQLEGVRSARYKLGDILYSRVKFINN